MKPTKTRKVVRTPIEWRPEDIACVREAAAQKEQTLSDFVRRASVAAAGGSAKRTYVRAPSDERKDLATLLGGLAVAGEALQEMAFILRIGDRPFPDQLLAALTEVRQASQAIMERLARRRS